MYHFNSIKYITTTAIVTAILIGLGCLSTLIQVPGLTVLGGSYLQIVDIVLLPLIYFIPGPMTLFAGPIALSIVDIIYGAVIFLPITIITRVLMFVIIILFKRKFAILSFFCAVLPLIILYPIYTYLVSNFDKAMFIKELIIDIIQAITTYSFSLFVLWTLIKITRVSDNVFWNDQQFDFYKKNKDINKE